MQAHSEQPSDSIRQQVYKAGTYLVIRRAVFVILGLLGLLFINRVVGPGVQGLYSAAYGVFSYLQSVALMGTNIYLIRSQQDESKALFHLAFWWLLFYGIGLTVVSIGGLWLLGHYWVRTENFIEVSFFILLGISINVISYVPMSILEQRMDYRSVSIIEISSMLIYYLCAIPLALVGYGVWALVLGFWSGLLVQGIGAFAVARYCPRWFWSWEQLKPMVAYSFSQAAAGWLYNIRNLLPAFLLLPLAGKEAVGYLNIVNRFATVLNFAQETAGRLAVPAFARVRNDLQRLTKAISDAMQIQIISLGITFAGFTLFAPFLLPHMLGEKWSVEIIMITFIILCTRMLLSANFGIIARALHVCGMNMTMIYANILYAISAATLCYTALHLVPQQYRLYSYLLADMFAHLPTYYLIHRGMTRYIGRPNYRVTAIWTAAMIGLTAAPVVSWWLYVPSLALLLLPASRQQLKVLLRELRQHKSSTAGPD
jgi:PST family polysaccharide transporter